MAASTPRIELSTQRLDLGDGKPNEELRGELVVTNRFAESLDFSVTTTCGCMKPKPVNGSIEPGGRQTIELGIKLPGHANSEKNAMATIHTTTQRPHDPLPEAVSCAVLARCPAPFGVSPAYVDFGHVSRELCGDTAQEIRITSVRGQPPVSVEKLQVEHLQEAFQVASSAADGAVLVRVTLAPELPYGDQYDTLDLHLVDSDYVMRVPLHVQVVEALMAVPATVYLKRDKQARRWKPANVILLARGAKTRLGSVTIADGPAGLRIEDKGPAANGPRRVTLLLDQDAPALSDGASVRLRVEGMEQTCVVNLKLAKGS